MKSLVSVLEELSFLELNKDLSFGEISLPKGLNIPIYTKVLEDKVLKGEFDYSTKDVLEGVLSLYGADPDFKDRLVFKDFVAKLQPLLPFLYQEKDAFKALVMALGLINLELTEEGTYLLAVEKANELIKEGQDYSELARALLDLEVESWPVFYHRGFFLYNDGDYTQAMDQWQKALDYELADDLRDEIHSMMAQADRRKFFTKGKDLLFKERFLEAREAFATILEDFPHWYELHFYYGLSLRFLEEYREALSVFLNLLQLKGDDVYLYNEIGVCYLFLEEYQEAISIIKRGLALADNPDLRLNLAIGIFHSGDRLGALEELEKASKLAPDDPLIHQWLHHIGGDSCTG